MGCDIHMVLERKAHIRGKDTWVGLKEVDGPARSRNYALFAALAGVRAYRGNHVGEPRGIPEDASDMAIMHIESWDSGGHTHTHNTLEEFIAAYVKTNGGSPVVAESAAEAIDGGAGLVAQLECRLFDVDRSEEREDEAPIEYRLVIWFDN